VIDHRVQVVSLFPHHYWRHKRLSLAKEARRERQKGVIDMKTPSIGNILVPIDRMKQWFAFLSLSLVVAALSACERKSEIRVYRVSKAPLEEASPEQNAMPANAPSPSMPGGMAPPMPSRDSAPSPIKWKTPDGWAEITPSAMRYASFSAGVNENKIDISIVTFAGEGGSDADNVNRWRQQIGLPSMSPSAIATQVTQLKNPEASFSSIDIAGANARTLAAWTRRDGHVWFFKATGPNATVEKEKPNFVKFVESVRF
jgi:hypothetical protein